MKRHNMNHRTNHRLSLAPLSRSHIASRCDVASKLRTLSLALFVGMLAVGTTLAQEDTAKNVDADDAVVSLPANDAEESVAESAEAETSAPATILDRAYNAVRDALRSNVAPPLKRLHEPIDAWLGTLSLKVAMACALGLYGIAIFGVWLLRKSFVLRGSPGQEWYRDLRIWATLVIIPYVVIYWNLGM